MVKGGPENGGGHAPARDPHSVEANPSVFRMANGGTIFLFEGKILRPQGPDQIIPLPRHTPAKPTR
jgi:hypothetical protein